MCIILQLDFSPQYFAFETCLYYTYDIFLTVIIILLLYKYTITYLFICNKQASSSFLLFEIGSTVDIPRHMFSCAHESLWILLVFD